MENNPTWDNASQKAKMYGHLTGNLAAVENVWGSEWNNAVGKSAFLSKALDSEGSWCARQTKVSMSYGLRMLVTHCFIFFIGRHAIVSCLRLGWSSWSSGLSVSTSPGLELQTCTTMSCQDSECLAWCPQVVCTWRYLWSSLTIVCHYIPGTPNSPTGMISRCCCMQLWHLHPKDTGWYSCAKQRLIIPFSL